MGSRRDRLLAAVLVLAVLAAATLAAPDDRQIADPRASSFLSTDGGVKALYLTLQELGIPVARGVSPWTGDGPDSGALALIAPSLPPGDAELDALLRWIEAGGTLLYVARRGDPTLRALGLGGLTPVRGSGGASGAAAADSTDAAPTATVAAGPGAAADSAIAVAATAVADPGSGATGHPAFPVPHRWTEGVHAVGGFLLALRDTAGILAGDGAAPLLRTARGEVVAATWRRGRGRVVVWSEATPLRNLSLRRSGAAVVFARIAADVATKDRPLVFDEFHHGFRGDGNVLRGTLGFLRGTRPGHATLQLLAVVLALLAAAAVRFGAPLPPTPARRRSPLEHVDALAELYRQANARATARRLLAAQLARRLGRRPPAPDAADPDGALDALLAGLRADREHIDALRREWRRGTRADLVALAGAMDRLVSEVKRT
ncbi:MAG TPA: DUF4350 domain-containing protein [Longimicrobiales bacterium]